MYRPLRKILYAGLIAVMLFCVACGKRYESEMTSSNYIAEKSEDTELFANASAESITEKDKDLTTTQAKASEEDKEKSNIAESEGATTDSKISDEEVVPVNKQISLIMVGDILLHTPVEKSAEKEDGSYDFSALFAHTKDEIDKADIALVNQEVIIGGQELGVSGYPAFNAPFEIGDELVETGFDVILHATNHAVDKGKRGLINCMDFWNTKYPEIEYLGIHDSAEDQSSIYYYEQNGIKLAILNYTYGTNGINLPADMPWAVDILAKDRVENDLKTAEDNADFTIVCPHWGTEYNLGISNEQKKWAEIFVSNGADLVIGTHPHVIEPIEWYEAENGNSALIYYSLGNYVNWTSGTGAGTANRMVGGMAKVTIEKNDEEISISNYGVEALVSHVENGFGNVTTYPLAEYTSQLSEKNQIREQDNSFSYDYCVKLCDEIWKDWE